MVFTSRDIDTMIAHGGSQAWKINVRRAQRCKYLVCVWNAHGDHTNNPSFRDHHEAFLIARITEVEDADPQIEGPGRRIIRFREHKPISKKGAWPGDRKEFRYGTLASFGIPDMPP